MNEEEALRLVARLGLEPHPEGGYYRQTYRSEIGIDAPAGSRAAITSIYFLLSASNFSAFHRLTSDEIWHHYRGAPVAVEIIDANGNHCRNVIGDGSSWQTAIRAGCWFAAETNDSAAYALIGCDVAPGFVFDDFELAAREGLVARFPQHRALIERLTRPA